MSADGSVVAGGASEYYLSSISFDGPGVHGPPGYDCVYEGVVE